MEYVDQALKFAMEHKFTIAAIVPFVIAIVVLKILG